MSAFHFTLRAPTPFRLDLSPLLPERLLGMSEAEIAALPAASGRHAPRLGDLFAIRLGDEPELVLEGTDCRCDRIGYAMSGGKIRCEGEAGFELGRKMSGGRIEVAGSTGPFAASGLRGGEIVIEGAAGDFLGAPRPGETEGMAGGVVLVRGQAGARAADRLRRGLMVIEGGCGDYAGARMIAGTLVVLGPAGAMAGYLMRRGTLFAPARDLPPTFVETAPTGAVFRALLARTLASLSPRAAEFVAGGSFRRFAGDLAALGKGEAFVAA